MTDASATCAAPPIEPEFAACFRAPSVSRIVLVALFAAIGALGAMDFGFPPVPSTILNINALSVALANIALALLIAFDREGRWAGRIGVWLGAGLASLGWAYAARHATNHYPAREIVAWAVRSPALYAWLASIWIAAPVLMDARGRRYSRPFWIGGWALWAFGAASFASAISSASYHNALLDFGAERAAILGVCFAWMRAALASPALRRRTQAVVLAWLGLAAGAAAFLGALDWLGGEAVQRRLAEWNFVFVENPAAHIVLPRRRLLFPMLDFNRAGYFHLIAGMALFAVAFRRREKKTVEKLALAFAALAFWAMWLTYTRTAVAAAAAAIALWGAMSSRRVLVAMLAAAILGFICLPKSKRDYVAQSFQRETYIGGFTPGPGRRTESPSIPGRAWAMARA